MDTTKAQQKALDDALVAPKNCLMIRKCNQRLSSMLKSNEPTIQVALDALKLTPFYNAFEVSADVPEIYMQDHTINVDNFKDMLKICPKLPDQKFEEPPFEEEILPLIRDLRHTGDIKVLSDVNINHMHQPWRSLAAIINKCLSRKTTGLERLRLLMENKDSKKNNDMFYPRFTKVIVDYFMAKDPSISRRNKMFWHTARDDSMFTTIRVTSKHRDIQIYGANLPQHLTNQAMLESEAYKTYHAYAIGEKTSKPKKKKADSESSLKEKPAQASKGKRLKTSSKAAQSTKEKKLVTKAKAKGLTVLSEVALTEDEQMKLATKRSWIQTHSSHASGSGDEVDTLSKIPDEQPQKKSEMLHLASKMKEAIDVAVQLKSNKLREEAQAENQDFINSLDSNMNKIIKEHVKAQTSKIMSKVEKYVTKTLGAEVLVRSTNQPQTSYAVAYSLTELELKNILMDKMEENKSIDRSEVQKNLYNALVKAYNTNKDINSTYGDVVTISRGHGDEDKDKEPSAGSNR
ncbi:hypothetical protein Tco_1179878 [Tanacetum coccineum]